MKSVAPYVVFAAIVALACVSILGHASDRAQDFAAGDSVKTLGASRALWSNGSNPVILASNPITDLGAPDSFARNMHCMTIAPGANGDTVYFGLTHGGYSPKLWGYDPHGTQFFLVDSLLGEVLRCLVTRFDTIWGGTYVYPTGGSSSSGGRLMKFYPPDDSLESVGVPIPGDSIIEALTFGCGVIDSGWIYGGTGPANFDTAHTGGGSLFVYVPPGQAAFSGLYNLGWGVENQRLVNALSSFRYPSDTGCVFGGTGLDSAYTFTLLGGDTNQSAETFELAQGGTSADVGGLCTIYPDTVYGCTHDSTYIFRYYAPSDVFTRLGYLAGPGETPYSSGPL
jgi:hypothetical protein